MNADETGNVRYMVDDVAAAVDFYTPHFGFVELSSSLPAFADVSRGHLRLLSFLRDRAFRILPLTDADAGELVRSLRASPLLFGYRGSPPVAVDALEDVLQRVARLAAVVPELAELDFNPVIVSPDGVEVVDSQVRIVPAPPAPDEHLRRLS